MGNDLGLFRSFVFGLTLWAVVKWFVVAGLFMYLAFAVVMIRQVKIMGEVLENDPINPIIELVAWAHLAMAILLILLAIVVL